MNTTTLPINAVLDDIRQQLRAHDRLVLQAPPGAGKTTLVPLALLNEPWLARQKILMLEPRRMAARTSALRMASLLNESIGETVGYRMRQDNKIGPATRIEVITEGVLTRMLQDDPELQGVGLIIFDEFHERNLNTDLGLALSLQAGQLFRDDDNPLKLLVMSATLDSAAVVQLLDNAPLLSSEGRMYPVQLHYASSGPGVSTGPQQDLIDSLLKTISRALTDTPGSILVFLPGQGEIRQLHKSLAPRVDTDVCILPLYGALPLSEQLQAIAPLDQLSPYRRKIVLATDIAETSLTIDGISTVIDSGLCRQPRFDPASGMTRLHTRRISQASSNQRMGRAGRTEAGHCYRLWSEASQNSMEKQSPAEILQADLCPLALQLLHWGIDDPDELQWLDSPPAAAFNQALDLLYALGALQDNPQQQGSRRLSEHGQQMALLPVHPRLAHMLIRGAQLGHSRNAAALACLLSEKDPLSQYASDIDSRVVVLLGDVPCEKRHKGWLMRNRQQMARYQQLCRPIKRLSSEDLAEQDVNGLLISQAYPDRIAQRRAENRAESGARYLLSNGRAANLKDTDKLARNDYLAVAELGGIARQREDVIYSAAPLNPQLFDGPLSSMLTPQDILQWDERSARLTAERQQRVGALIIHRRALTNIPLEERHREVIKMIRQKGLALLPWDNRSQQLRARIQCLRSLDATEDEKHPTWPDLTDKHLLDTLEHWLQPYLDDINRIEDFQRLDLHSILLNLLPWPLPQRLDEQAPLSLQVPSGSNIKIDYSQSPPVLAVKLQEMFGCQQTPAIANGRMPLLVHLLSPGGKPLQITQDVAGFWQGSYQDVKKEMKGRYPKHPWPDDPLQAPATRFCKPRKPKG